VYSENGIPLSSTNGSLTTFGCNLHSSVSKSGIPIMSWWNMLGDNASSSSIPNTDDNNRVTSDYIIRMNTCSS